MTENGKEDEDQLGQGEGIRQEKGLGEEEEEEERFHRGRRKLKRRWTKI